MPLHKSKYIYEIRNRFLKSAHNNKPTTKPIFYYYMNEKTTLNDLYFYRERPFNLIYCSTLLYSYYKQINFFSTLPHYEWVGCVLYYTEMCRWRYYVYDPDELPSHITSMYVEYQNEFFFLICYNI